MKLIKKLKATVKSISWPSFKMILKDTALVVVVAGLISLVILGLSFGVDKIFFMFL